MDPSHVWTLMLVLVLVGYLSIGALVFSKLEAATEATKRAELRLQRLLFLQKNSCVSEASLEKLIVAIVEANNRGLSAVNNVSSEPNWSFGQSLFFSATIVTTIGYGHVTPLSEEGKLFCILYSMFGIPLTLILFTALVERLLCFTRRFIYIMATRMGKTNMQDLSIRLSLLTFIFSIVIVFILMVPAIIFMVIEKDWNYLDAFYYCYISLTTIGLGDYIPGDSQTQTYRLLYKIITTVYLFIGLTFMMLVMAALYDVPELNIGYNFYLRKNKDDLREDEDDVSGVTSMTSSVPICKETGSEASRSTVNNYAFDETTPLGRSGHYALYQGHGDTPEGEGPVPSRSGSS